MAVRGDDPLKIMRRAGHSDFQTTQIYIREAEHLRESNFGTPFPPLRPCLIQATDHEPAEPSIDAENPKPESRDANRP